MPALIVRTLAITSSSSAPALVVVAGEIDMASEPQLAQRLQALPDRDIVLELSAVGFMSAAGVHLLLELRSRLARTGAHLMLANPSTPVRRILTLSGLNTMFASGTTVSDALLRLTTANRIQRCTALRPTAK
jgi:anti-sigma B factor antagonist